MKKMYLHAYKNIDLDVCMHMYLLRKKIGTTIFEVIAIALQELESKTLLLKVAHTVDTRLGRIEQELI